MKYSIIGLILGCALSLSAQKTPNVLFIAIDDLKPEIGAYGADYVVTPHMDALADQGVTFTNAHCQQAVCGPSRASLMTGMRPDYTGVWDLKTRMRDINPDILAMPEHFRNQGYNTVAVGKIYDPRCVDKQYDLPSWSVPYSESSQYTYPEEYGAPGLSYYALPENKAIVHKLEAEAEAKGVNRHKYVSERFKPSVEMADVPDDAYIDGQITNNAVRYMAELSKDDKPFFLGVGYKRPHLPFAAPTKYWELYERENIKLAEFREPAKNGVDIAYHNSGEMQSYTDIPPLTSFSDINTMILPESKQKELIHAYYASVSYIDAQIGRLMDELKANGLDENTVVVMWGDHGWHLGDHNLWCKHSNFEQATRVPFIISAPGYNVSEYKHPAELIDIFPTLCELTGVPTPAHLQGASLVPALIDHHNMVKPAAVSQFSRGQREGHSIRTDRFRLTVWMNKKYKTYMPFDESLVYACELYDYKNDPLETVNVYDSEAYAKVKDQLFELFVEHVAIQNEELKYTGANPNRIARAEGDLVATQLPVKPLTIEMFASDKSYKTIVRKGASIDAVAKDGNIKATVNSLGENPWDLGLISKQTMQLKAGDKVKFSFAHQGGEVKIQLRKEAGKGKVKKVKASPSMKETTFTLEAEQAGSYAVKVEFINKGVYEIKDFQVSTK